MTDFRAAFPVTTYETYKPLLARVMAGDTGLLLTEEPIGWAITRGSTKGESKFIPMTPTDLSMRVSVARAMLNFVATTGRADLFKGVNLNLNFPSEVGKVKVGEREVAYGTARGSTRSTFRPARPSGPSRRRTRSTRWAGQDAEGLGRALRAGLPEVQGSERHAGGRGGATAVSFGAYLRRSTAPTRRTSGRRR